MDFFFDFYYFQTQKHKHIIQYIFNHEIFVQWILKLQRNIQIVCVCSDCYFVVQGIVSTFGVSKCISLVGLLSQFYGNVFAMRDKYRRFLHAFLTDAPSCAPFKLNEVFFRNSTKLKSCFKWNGNQFCLKSNVYLSRLHFLKTHAMFVGLSHNLGIKYTVWKIAQSNALTMF